MGFKVVWRYLVAYLGLLYSFKKIVSSETEFQKIDIEEWLKIKS